MAVTTQESLDGIREKVMRIASLDELSASSSAGRWSSSGGADKDRNKKVNEIVRAIAGLMTKEEDIVVASDSKNWNMKYVDVARSPGSATRVFTSSERLANQTSCKIGDEERGMLRKLENW